MLRYAIIAADQHDIGVSFGNTRGNRSDADFGHQLDADAGTAVGIFQIVDQLGKILDGVDIMVRRRRDQTDPRSGVTGLGDPGIDLGAGQFPPRPAWRPEPS